MRVMVMVKATKSSEAGEMPSEQLLREMGQYNEELVQAGIMLAGEGLQPTSKGARVRFSGSARDVIDGPFTETKELVAGYWIWQVSSMEEAIAWVKRCPNPMPEESEIEIRPLFEMEDFGEEMTPELREQEDRLRERLARGGDSADEVRIRELAAEWRQALEQKDVEGLSAGAAEDVVLYDCKPPYEIRGQQDYRANWEACLPYFPDRMRSEHRGLTIVADGDVAFAYGLHRVQPLEGNSAAGQTWLRVTIGYRRIDGEWKAVHEHVSVPFDPATGQVAFITDDQLLPA